MTITMPRGDIRPVRFVVFDQDETETEIEFSEIYFTVKRSYADNNFLFQKKLSDGTITPVPEGGYQLVIESADTDPLRIGKYVFDIELVAPGLKQTTVGDLVLTNEVTFATNEG